jgi:hypothetical protein
MKKAKKQKAFWEMTPRELAAATREYDLPMSGIPGKPLSAADRARHARANRKGGRPKIGRGVKVISLSVEKELLAQADALARRRGMTRAALFTRGLKAVLAKAG